MQWEHHISWKSLKRSTKFHENPYSGSTKFYENTCSGSTKFHEKSVQWESNCSMWTDGWPEYRQSYSHGEVNSSFSQFCGHCCKLKHVFQEQGQPPLQAQQCRYWIVGPDTHKCSKSLSPLVNETYKYYQLTFWIRDHLEKLTVY